MPEHLCVLSDLGDLTTISDRRKRQKLQDAMANNILPRCEVKCPMAAGRCRAPNRSQREISVRAVIVSSKGGPRHHKKKGGPRKTFKKKRSIEDDPIKRNDRSRNCLEMRYHENAATK